MNNPNDLLSLRLGGSRLLSDDEKRRMSASTASVSGSRSFSPRKDSNSGASSFASSYYRSTAFIFRDSVSDMRSFSLELDFTT